MVNTESKRLAENFAHRFNALKLATTMVGASMDSDADRSSGWIDGVLTATDRCLQTVDALESAKPLELAAAQHPVQPWGA